MSLCVLASDHEPHNAVRVGGILPRALLPVCRVAILVAVQGSATGAGTVGGRHAVAAF